MSSPLRPPWTAPARCSGAVVVAGASTDVVAPDRVDRERARLDGDLSARHDRLARPIDRLDLLAGRRLARVAVATLLDADPEGVEITQRCPVCAGTDHGAPAATLGPTPVSVSWAHAGGQVAAAAAPAHLRLGVDVETGRGDGWPGTTPRERARLESLAPLDRPDVAFRRLWSAKESLVKAGVLRLDDLARTDLLGAVPEGSDGLRGARWWTFDGPDGAVVGLAVVEVQERCCGSVP